MECQAKTLLPELDLVGKNELARLYHSAAVAAAACFYIYNDTCKHPMGSTRASLHLRQGPGDRRQDKPTASSRRDHLAVVTRRRYLLLAHFTLRPCNSCTAPPTLVLPSTNTFVMAQMRSNIGGTAGYHLGNQGPYGGAPSRTDASADPSPLEQIRAQTSKIEDMLDTLSEPVKP